MHRALAASKTDHEALALVMLQFLENLSYTIHRICYGGNYTLCARAHDMQGRSRFWRLFRVIADRVHPEADHCRKSAERHL
jgi:hypothetical protein